MTRRGRRDNGLEASSFVPLRDVDPRVGEHLLDVLYIAGIAAYLEPTSDIDSYTRAVSLPSPPSDRLFVDRASRPAATSLIAEHADDAVPTPTARDSDRAVDDAWAAIVADYHRDSDTPVPPWPAAEDESEDADPPAQDGGVRRSRIPTRRERPTPPAEAVASTAEDVDPEDHYVPPPPPPVPRLQQGTLGALVSIAFGAMLLVAPGVLDLGGDISFVLGVFGIVFGVGMLVYRMREKLPDEDNPDDGAVV